MKMSIGPSSVVVRSTITATWSAFEISVAMPIALPGASERAAASTPLAVDVGQRDAGRRLATAFWPWRKPMPWTPPVIRATLFSNGKRIPETPRWADNTTGMPVRTLAGGCRQNSFVYGTEFVNRNLRPVDTSIRRVLQ
jgi:hypothetical protein